jgi:porin
LFAVAARIGVAMALLCFPSLEVAQADGSKKPPTKFGGPDSVPKTIEEDEMDKRPVFETGFLDDYHEFKKRLTERTGFSYGVDYSAVYLHADDSPGKDDASGGMIRFYGSWDLAGRESGNTGTFIWKVEHRHRYGTLPPSDFSFELGNIGLFEPPFSDQGLRLTNLYWRQRFLQGRVAVVGGFLDATDYVDVYALASPWLHFMNFAFSTGTTTMSLPNDALIGVAAAGWVTDKLYLMGGFGDTNSDPTDPLEGFDTFFTDNEYFKHVEIGWATGEDRFFYDTVHLTLWQADERDAAQVPDDWGINFSFSHEYRKWRPFVRAGWADEGIALMKKSASAGIGFAPLAGSNLLGIGVNWGEPSESFGTDLDDQYAVEAFYRLQLSDETALTTDVQLLLDPALNPEVNSIWVIGLRVRIAL